jgi:hypothetical protein
MDKTVLGHDVNGIRSVKEQLDVDLARLCFRLDQHLSSDAFDSPRQISNALSPICQPSQRNIYNRPPFTIPLPTSSSSLLLFRPRNL